MPTHLRLMLFLSLTLLCFQGRGQDTISLYFEIGDAKLRIAEKQKIDQLSKHYDLENLDSVTFIGRTDTTGRITENLKLSHNRAVAVKRYLNHRWEVSVPQSIQAIGEESGSTPKESRRVDMVLHFPNLEEELPDPSGDFCYRIDYKTLRNTNVSYSKGKRRATVSLEIESNDWMDTVTHYTGQRLPDGGWKVRKVRWKRRVTGSGKWSKMRMVATLPQAYYDSSKLLIRNLPPCDSCALTKDKNPPLKTCDEIDRFLMRNLQFKKRWFKPEYQVRAPALYIDENAVYRRSMGGSIIHWKPVKKGKYFKTTLPGNRYFLSNILKEQKVCQFDTCGNPNSKIVKCRRLRTPARAFGFELEGGYSWLPDQPSPFVGVNFNFRGPRNYSRWLFGLDNQERMYSSWQTQFTLLWIDFSRQNLAWQGPQSGNLNYSVIRLYAGTEVRAGLPLDDRLDFVEQNVHLGFAVQADRLDAWFVQWYLQGGMAYEYSDYFSQKVYPILQLGMNFKLVRFKPKPLR
ncbi:OmpA family protein [bacterium SCSIO 12741]|nr:OmpA family protein [bacterium SCSIO 12741]